MTPGWRTALRIARRDALRNKGRTTLILLMVLLPVTAVVALETLMRTREVSPAESLPAELGNAEARIHIVGGRVTQLPGDSFFGQPIPPDATVPHRPRRLPSLSCLTVRRSSVRVLRTRKSPGRPLRAPRTCVRRWQTAADCYPWRL